MNNNSSFWTVFKQSLTEQGKGSSKRFIAYWFGALIGFIVIRSSIKETLVDSNLIMELLIGIGGLLGISAWQQQKGVTNPALRTPTVNPDIPETPKQPG